MTNEFAEAPVTLPLLEIEKTVPVPRSFPLSKTAALRFIAERFRNPGFQNITNGSDRANGFERWRLYCKGDYGCKITVCDLTGPASVLPKAAVAEAFGRLGFDVSFDWPHGGTANIKLKPKSAAVEAAP